MAQHDFNIANQSFPSFRTDLNNALSAINTSQSGTSRPSGAVSGTIWLDTTSATTPTLKYYDGADDISLATLDHSANTVNWLDSTVSITGLSTTATGTVLTLSDSATTSTVNLIIDNQKEIRFRETTANGTNYIGLKAPASVTADLTFTLPVAPTVNNQALISTTAGVMAFTPYTFPTSDGTASQVLQTNGSGVLSFNTVSAGTYSVHAISRYNYQTAVTASTGNTNYIDISGGNYVSFTPTSTNDVIFLSHYCSVRQGTAASGVDTYLMMATSASITSSDTKLNYDGQNMFYDDSNDMYHFVAKSFLLPCTSLTPSTTYYIEQAAALHNSNSTTWNYNASNASGNYKNHNVSLIHYKYN
jgi:hypothetical protein